MDTGGFWVFCCLAALGMEVGGVERFGKGVVGGWYGGWYWGKKRMMVAAAGFCFDGVGGFLADG